MRYHEAAEFLLGLRRFSMSPGTDAVAALLDRLGSPEAGVAFVQVGGSNGKGSVARMVESTLREAGLSVGLYTSPHLEDLTERITVDGREMTERAVADFVAEVRPWLVDRAAAGEPLTFFEVVTAMAIHEFDRRGVDVAVLEVGMGGEYDATSVVDPVATAVTTVDLEHTDVLGDDRAEIARTKAKIAAGGAPLVTAADGEALAVIREVAADVTTVTGADGDGDRGGGDVRARYGGRVGPGDARVSIDLPDGPDVEARIPLVGRHQATNAAVAVTLARLTATALPDRAVPVDARTIERGFARATWPGRFEVLREGPLVVLDGGHNPAACRTIARTLDEYDYDDLHLAFGAMANKDHAGMVAALPADTAVTCAADVDRAEDPAVLAAAFERDGVPAEPADSVAAALSTVRERADPGDCVLLAGSLYAVAEARRTFTRRATPVRLPDRAAAERTLTRAGVPDDGLSRAAEGAVARTVRLRVGRREAERIERTLLRLGGEASLSGLRAEATPVDAVLSATHGEFAALCRALDDAGLDGIAREIRRRVGLADGGSRGRYPWEDGTAIMGVLNVTPDSFHDGGDHFDPDDAVAGARRLVDAGASIVDVGGESTRPGAEPVPAAEEIDRIVPVIEAVAGVDALVSVDSRKPAVARAALDAGAGVVNDVTGLRDPEMRALVAERDVPVIVMHSLDAPVDPDREPEYDDVVADVIDALGERVLAAEKAGIPRENVIVDPGIGFGKSNAGNFALLGRLDEFDALGCPVLVGHSHKSLFGGIGRGPDDRLHATVAATALAAERGADIVRVHDADENRAAVDVIEAATDPDRVGGG